MANVLTLRTEKSKSAILAACLKPGTQINTTNGLKNIENITNNDYVYTCNGIERVITPTTRDYSGKLYTFKSGIGVPFTATHNHQLLVYTNRHKQEKDGCQNYKECQLLDSYNNVIGTFTSIKQAAKYYAKEYNGSFTSMYKYRTTNGYSIVEIPTIKNNTIQWLTAEDIVESDYLLTPIYNTQEYKKQIVFPHAEQNPSKKSVNYIKENIVLDKEFCELVGIYLAEGNINSNKHGITFTISREEEWLKNRITYLLNSVFGIKEQNIGYYSKSDSLGLSIKVHSTPLGRFFYKHFYGNAHTKNIGIINYLPPNLQKYTLYGCYYGDGYGRIKQNNCYEGKITSVSYQLIADLWQIAARNGYNCSVITEQHQSLTYNLMFYGKTAESLYKSKYLHDIDLEWTQDEYLSYNGINYYPIRILNISEDNYCGKVYCLETPSHNYLLNNVVSHNCRGLGVDVDIAQYIASLVPAERGQLWSLHDCMYGNDDDRAPVKQFVYEMTENYPEIWEVISQTEGLIVGMGEHAGGLVLIDEPFTNSTALMRAPNGDVMTQFELHTAERASLIKLDLLSVEAIDKMQICLELLREHGYIDKTLSLRAAYEQTIGVYQIDRNIEDMWHMVWDHKINSLFQLEQQSGITGIAALHPTSVDDLAVLNSAIRLMAQEKGGEMPVNKLARFKSHPADWDREIEEHYLNVDETKKLLNPILNTSYGLCIAQEQFMQLVQMPELGGMTLTDADALRKSIAKKNPAAYDKWIEKYRQVCQEKGIDEKLVNYVIELIGMSKGYGSTLGPV